MITRNTKSRPTNRQRQIFPKFRFAVEWLEYIENIADEDEQLKMFAAVSDYGINANAPNGLTPCNEDYFNREIRPDLDRQHKRFKEGKSI